MGKPGRPVAYPDSKIFHLRIDNAVLAHLEEIATNQGGRTIASVIRQAVDEFLKANPRQRDDFDDLLPAPSTGAK